MLVHRRRHSSPQHGGSGLPGTNGQRFFSCCGYSLAAASLAAAYRSAHSSQRLERGQALAQAATHVSCSVLYAGPSCALQYASWQPGLKLEAHRPSPVLCLRAAALAAPQEGSKAPSRVSWVWNTARANWSPLG